MVMCHWAFVIVHKNVSCSVASKSNNIDNVPKNVNVSTSTRPKMICRIFLLTPLACLIHYLHCSFSFQSTLISSTITTNNIVLPECQSGFSVPFLSFHTHCPLISHDKR